MKALLVACLLVPFVAAGEVFQFKDDHEAVYHMEVDAIAPGKTMNHKADLLLKKGHGAEIHCRLKNIKVDEQVEEINHADVWELLREQMIFKFDEAGSLEFIKPDDLEEPHIFYHDQKMIDMILKGERKFTKKLFVPMTEKKCKGDFLVTEEDDVYKVTVKVEPKCMNHPMVDTIVSLEKVLLKETFELQEYSILTTLSVSQDDDDEPKVTTFRMNFKFQEFVPIEPPKSKKNTKNEL